MCLLTVITPCKNHLEGLRLATESLVSQSFKDWEHLVIDSASTDGTVEYCTNRPQTRIISEADRCVEAAFTKGLKLAKGKYVTFLLCYDSLIDPDWLKTAVDFLENNPDYSLISGTSGPEGLDDIYSYYSYPSGPKFNYFFFIAPWTIINETAFVGRTPIIREHLPNFQTSNRSRDVFFQLWIELFKNGYLAHFCSHKVARNDTHEDSRVAADAQTGEMKAKISDFYQGKRAVRRGLLSGKFRIQFKGSDDKELPIVFSRFAFILATFYYKLNLFFLRKILRRKYPTTQCDFCLRLGRKSVDFAVRD
jgi:glycosyltransferase involved in cell wall biosynthesis